jgi:hypothetical protein
VSLNISQVRDTFLAAGFVETEAAGTFRWYESPSSRVRQEQNILAYVRSMFYGGEKGGELQIWVNVVGNGTRGRMAEESSWRGYVDSPEDIGAAIRTAIGFRMRVALEEMVKWDDPRVTQFPRLFAAARSPYPEDRHGAELLLTDALFSRGIEF